MTLPEVLRGPPRRKDKPAQTHRFIAKREAILDAAARQFNKHGLKGATLADVAGSVDLLTNSVTYYYRRKEDLVAACLLRAIETMQGVAVAALAAPSPEARIRAFICGHAAVLADIAAGGATNWSISTTSARCGHRWSIMCSPPIPKCTAPSAACCPRKGLTGRRATRARICCCRWSTGCADGSGVSSPTTIAMPPTEWATSSLTGWRASPVNGWNVRRRNWAGRSRRPASARCPTHFCARPPRW